MIDRDALPTVDEVLAWAAVAALAVGEVRVLLRERRRARKHGRRRPGE